MTVMSARIGTTCPLCGQVELPADALIIDLRGNGGGNPAMVALICSYLFGPEPVHLNDLYWREGNRTEEFWTRKEVAGKRYLNKDDYVLRRRRIHLQPEESQARHDHR